MARRILVINGHPDPRPERACAALVQAYVRGARDAGHEVRRIDAGALDFPLIRSAEAFAETAPPAAIKAVQDSIVWAEHLVLVFPLWLGGPPALVKGLLEQTFRYGFALSAGPGLPKGLLSGRSARLIVTMGMPSVAYRWIFGAFGVRAIERSIFWLSGVRPIRRTLIGMAGSKQFSLKSWLKRMRRIGAAGA